MECDWAAYNAVIAAVKAIPDRNQQMAAAVAQGFPARISLVQNVSTMMYDLMGTVGFACGFASLVHYTNVQPSSSSSGFDYGRLRSVVSTFLSTAPGAIIA